MTGFGLVGHEQALAVFDQARQSGHLHHAWILKGPSGIGKSLMARQLAAEMLGADLSAAEDPVTQKVQSGSHPDLAWIERDLNEKGKLRQDITVDQIRDLNRFFSLKPALAGWRVGVIDAIDEMNVSGLNALLKTLEEPPEKSLLFLIFHGEMALLPTIRSRCQVLKLKSLSDEDVRTVIEREGGVDTAVMGLASGRPGLALSLDAANVAPVIQATRDALRHITKPGHASLAEALGKAAQNETALRVFAKTILDWCALEAVETPAYGQAWLELQRVLSEAEALNQTPVQTAAKLWSVLQSYQRSLIAA